jgi:hypothetical protein
VRDLNEERCFSYCEASTHEIRMGSPAGREEGLWYVP